MLPQQPTANPNFAMFAQMAQGGQGMPQGAPPMPPQMQQPPMQPPPGAPPMASPSMPAGARGGSGGPASRFTPEELGALGRFGDTLVAHLTPGEITIPIPLQTPKVLATIKKAAEDKGADPQKLVAGSPQSSVNPQTGIAEYNFMSAFLPIALGLAGTALAPGVGTALGSSLGAAATGAIGGGLGTTLGGLLTGQKPLQAGLSGLGAGAGGYLLGNLMSPAASAAGETAGNAGAQGAAQSANNAGLGASTLSGGAYSPGSAITGADKGFMSQAFQNAGGGFMPGQNVANGGFGGPGMSNFSNLWGNLPQGMTLNPASMAGSAIGSQIGSSLGAPQKPIQPVKPSGFNDRMTPVGDLPSWQEQLGNNTYKGPNPTFAGFDPLSSDPTRSTGFNFYPIQPPQIPRIG